MKKTSKSGLYWLIFALIPSFLIADEAPPIIWQDASEVQLHPYCENLINQLEERATADSTVSEDTQALQLFLIQSLRVQRNVCICGPDELARPPLVALQTNIEKILSEQHDSKEVKRVVGVMHANRPSTPLCNVPGEVCDASIHETKRDNTDVRKSITDRTYTLREFAKRYPLYSAYPRGGLKQRSAEEQAIYKSFRKSKSNKEFRDFELNKKEIPLELVGATYIITTKKNETMIVSIGGMQATDDGEPTWQVWMGKMTDPELTERFENVYEYLRGGGLILPL